MKTRNSKPFATVANNKEVDYSSVDNLQVKLNATNKRDDNEVDSISELSQSSIIIPSQQLSPDLRLRNESPTLRSKISFQVMTPLRQLSPALESRFAPSKCSSPALGSRINIQNDFTSFYQNSINLMIAPL
ncbi:19177_t:CDS:2 [Dentiscutata erythropus]|uniref:19177_t:CDS:1 n=1 Tax=Dentiscutata erythropus TaxID=1348616 RepID=A0A9N8W8Q4_9GLOM|nr:19177_t:CDS:2 [Dentiscutata erythropus]